MNARYNYAMKTTVVIVGGGLAGLSAATILQQAGVDWVLLEKSASFGGRVQTDNVNGFLCDRGFQVLLSDYPTAKSLLDYEALRLKWFPRGAVIHADDAHWFGLPFMYPRKFQHGQKLSLSFGDYVCFAKDTLNSGYPNQFDDYANLDTYLTDRFSSEVAELFLKPFLRGVFLDQDLDVHPALFRYYIRLFLTGGVCLPVAGMGALGQSLLDTLPQDKLLSEITVSAIEKNGVYTDCGQSIQADHVILATEEQGAARLLKKNISAIKKRPVHTVFFRTTSVDSCTPLMLFPKATICQQLAIPSLVQASYAPAGEHLVMATCLQNEDVEPDHVCKELEKSLGECVQSWEFLHRHHIEYALPTGNRDVFSAVDNVHVCGDWTLFGSIETAMRSGVNVAKRVNKIVDGGMSC